MDTQRKLFLQGMASVLKNLIEHQGALCLSGGGEYCLAPSDVTRLIGSWRKEDFKAAELPYDMFQIIESYLP